MEEEEQEDLIGLGEQEDPAGFAEGVLVGQSRRPKQGQKHEMELCFCSISINFGFCSLFMVACGHKYLMLKFKSAMFLLLGKSICTPYNLRISTRTLVKLAHKLYSHNK